MWHEWSTLEKLIWLRRRIGGGASWVWQTITGSAPLTLANAVSHAIHSMTQYGLCTQASTPTPSAPVDILCNNGAIKYGALGANLCDPSAANTVLEYYINKADGEVKSSPPNFLFANYMPVVGGKTYVAYGRAKSGNDLSDYNRVAWYDSNKNWLSGADYTQNRIAVVTAPKNAAYARFSCNPSGTTTVVATQELVDSYNWMFAEGTAEITPFVPFVGGIYTDGTDEVLTVSASGAETQTVTDIPMLLSVDDYADEGEIISGLLTHKAGVKVLDGTETGWTQATTSTGVLRFYLPFDGAATPTGAREQVASTHFAYAADGQDLGIAFLSTQTRVYFIPTDQTMTGTTWKAWLAEQYAAGTPVIVVYHLATEQTEQGTAHNLHTSNGDNVVDVTANVSPVELEVEYASNN